MFLNSLLALVDLDVPLSPDLGRGKHATGTAHVTEGSLTGTVSTTTRDTGNTGNSTTCSHDRQQSVSKNMYFYPPQIQLLCSFSCSVPSKSPNWPYAALERVKVY
jgi:hypothetical protein